MPAGLFNDTMAGICKDNGEVCRRGTGDHVPSVLDMTGSVSNDELSFWRREISVRYVNRDALFTFGFEAIG